MLHFQGATGFLGKVLIEKLLRSCDGLRSILILLRPKRGLSSEQRFDEFIKHPVFDRIRGKTPEMLERVEFITGDLGDAAQIGLSDQDRERLLEEVTIVFHVAATVRFNESLRDAANLNTLGTQRVMELCVKMRNLKVFLGDFQPFSFFSYVKHAFYRVSCTFQRHTVIQRVRMLENLCIHRYRQSMKMLL